MAFDEATYERIRVGCMTSAHTVVPDLSALIPPGSPVVDVGGGEGWWARELARWGHPATVLDGHAGVTRAAKGVSFEEVDLAAPDLPAKGPFALALCLEVAEHLPERAAHGFVGWLAGLAPIVVFGAAIPGQGGHMHLNERWPDYWFRIFVDHGMEGVSDDLRWRFWDDTRVEPWYRQNLLVYARDREALQAHGLSDCVVPKSVVHPEILGWRLADIRELAEQTPR